MRPSLSLLPRCCFLAQSTFQLPAVGLVSQQFLPVDAPFNKMRRDELTLASDPPVQQLAERSARVLLFCFETRNACRAVPNMRSLRWSHTCTDQGPGVSMLKAGLNSIFMS